MTDGFSKIRDYAKDNQKRWKKIDAIVERLEQLPQSGNQRADLNTELLLLILEQLRPAADYNNIDKELNKFQKDINNLVENIMKTPGRK